MIAFILLGLFVGLLICGINRIYSVREFAGFAFVAFVGALEGRILGNFLSSEMDITAPFFTSLIIIGGALLLPLMKLGMLHFFKPTQVSV